MTKLRLKTLLLAVLGTWMTGNTWALDKDNYGTYQIRTVQDWNDFCTLHNNGDNQELNFYSNLIN